MPHDSSFPSLANLFATNGELYQAKMNETFVLKGASDVFLLESGHIEMFVSQIAGSDPVGPRSHFVTLEGGSVFFAMDFGLYGNDSGLLASCTEGSRIYRMAKEVFRESVAEDGYAAVICQQIDEWLITVSASVVRDIRPKPKPDQLLVGGMEIRLPRTQVACAREGIVWIEVTKGESLYIGMEGVSLAGDGVPILPISHDTWIEAHDDNVLRSFASSAIITKPIFWQGIDLFHETACQCEFINKDLRMVDEFNRVRLREAFALRAKDVALREIASVLDGGRSIREGADLSDSLNDLLLAACKIVGEACGIRIQAPPDLARSKEKVLVIAKASRCRVRTVALRDNWWETDHGPLLAYRDRSFEPVAVVKTKSNRYELVEPRTFERVSIDETVAATLGPFAVSFYASLPAQKLTAWDLIKFGARESNIDLLTILLMGVLVGFLGIVTPYFSGQIFDSIIPSADRNQLMQFSAGLIAVAFGTFAFELVRALAVLRVEGKMDYSVQAGIMDRLLDLPSVFFRQYTSGDLADRTLGVDQIRQAVSQAGTQAVVGTISALIMLFFLFTYNWQMALVAFFLLVGSVGFPLAWNFLQLRYQREMFYIRGTISGLVLQLINGVNKLRVSGSEDRAFREWTRKFARQKQIAFTAGRIVNVVQVFNQIFPVISSAVLFGAYAYFQQEAARNNEKFKMTTGDFVAFNALFMNILSSMLQLSAASLDLMIIFPLAERLRPIIETTPEIDEAKAHPGELSGEIEVYHITFRYERDGPAILKDVSFHVRAGEYIALVGGSGSGKSTLLRLMLGFERPESGSIFYDGQDLSSLDLREVRQQIGVVLQSSKLMPTDIFRNIVGARNLTVNDAWEAARMAGLDRDIKAMPMGMHTVVSEGGGTFSGGQRQRLMIARALVNKPRIIFFDEATSALDNETQRTVTDSLDAMQSTRIVIAHRLSTIINADKIYVLMNGEMVQSGTYSQLMDQPGPFADLAKRQLA